MSGFERAESGDAWTEAEEFSFPDDFTTEEAAFAADLREWFAVERDELPPLYAQTLLAEDRHAPVARGYEYTIIASVFRRLSMRRHLFHTRPLRLAALSVRDSWAAVTRPLATMAAAILIFMVATVVLASPSFGAGLRILLGHTGVQRVASYPSGVQSSRTQAETVGKQHDPFAQGAPLYWLGSSFGDFTFSGLQATDTGFARGAMIDVQYMSSLHGRLARMDAPARLDIREFRVSDAYAGVLQVVPYDSTTEVTLPSGEGVYVNGMWTCYGCKVPIWQSGERNQLILERDGVVFWISGDQSAGVNQAMLIAAAKQLVPIAFSALPPVTLISRDGQAVTGRLVDDPSQGEVWALVRAGESLDTGAAALVTAPVSSQGGH